MLKGKKILIVGLSITGISATKALSQLGAIISITDSRTSEELKETIKSLENYKIENFLLGTNDIELDGYDLILKSPGIKPDIPIFQKAYESGIEVVSDIELAYRIGRTKHIIAITGTNGKTTTTTLVGEIFKNAGKNTYVVGNIGTGILEQYVDSCEEDYFVVEASSFQLEHTSEFRPEASLITNITPDHLDWHGSYENYVNSKKKIYINQKDGDVTVINLDDEASKELEIGNAARIIYFSKTLHNKDGAYIDNDYIVVKDRDKKIEVVEISKIHLLGAHNLENVLSAVCLAYFSNISVQVIRETIEQFHGVEHRIEFVAEIEGVKYYNDSKGTNPDSTIKAIEAVPDPIVLIAGGYDKGSDFDELAENLHRKVYHLILMGATREAIRNAAVRSGFTNIDYVNNMKEAVDLAYEVTTPEMNVLLSPACASWGMYNNYEERGNDFKNCVKELRSIKNE